MPAPAGVRIGGMTIDFTGVKAVVMTQPFWLFSATHNDANLPSTVLMKNHVVFDYPEKRLTIARPGAIEPRGTMVRAHVHRGDRHRSGRRGDRRGQPEFRAGQRRVLLLRRRRPPRAPLRAPSWDAAPHGHDRLREHVGMVAAEEETLPLFRLPEVAIGSVSLTGVGIVGVTDVFPNGYTLGRIYSMKSARPVAGFLGPNAFIDFRVEIDYAERGRIFRAGRTARGIRHGPRGACPAAARRWRLRGAWSRREGRETARRGCRAAATCFFASAICQVNGATMGAVVDALRGVPGEIRTLVLEREGVPFTIEAKVERCLGMN